MCFFNPQQPILRPRQRLFHLPSLEVKSLELRFHNRIIFSSVYTCIDQALFLWGVILLVIFCTAQLTPISWITQAIAWSILTVMGTIIMIALTYLWSSVEGFRWILYCWVFLMLIGTIITDLGIFLAWGNILLHLCHIWLGLSAMGYLCTGIGIRSRAFVLAAIIHLAGISLLPYVGNWQYLTTGILMVGVLLLFTETLWDMQPVKNP